MTSAEVTSLRALHRAPVVLTGRWTSDKRDLWLASASAAEGLVGVNFYVAENLAHWSKSTRLSADSEAVRIGLGIHPHDPAYVIIACGWAGTPVRLRQPDVRPALADRIALETGVVWPLCRFDSEPPVEIYVLFLAQPDVRWGRNRLWRLRPERAVDLDEPFRSVLTGGRSGTCAWPTAR